MMSDDATYMDQIEKVAKKVRQKTGWVLRTFYSRKTLLMKTLFKTLVVPHRLLLATLDASQTSGNIENRKTTKRFLEQDSSPEGRELLGKVEDPEDDLAAKKTRKISNHLHLEDPGGIGPKLRNPDNKF